MQHAIVLALPTKASTLWTAAAIRYAEQAYRHDSYRPLPVWSCAHDFTLFDRGAKLIDRMLRVPYNNYASILEQLPAQQTMLITRPVFWDQNSNKGPREMLNYAGKRNMQTGVYGMMRLKDGKYEGGEGYTWWKQGAAASTGDYGETHGVNPALMQNLRYMREWFPQDKSRGSAGVWYPAYETSVSIFSYATARKLAPWVAQAMDLGRFYAVEQPPFDHILNASSAMSGIYPLSPSGSLVWMDYLLELSSNPSGRAIQRQWGAVAPYGSTFDEGWLKEQTQKIESAFGPYMEGAFKM